MMQTTRIGWSGEIGTIVQLDAARVFKPEDVIVTFQTGDRSNVMVDMGK